MKKILPCQIRSICWFGLMFATDLEGYTYKNHKRYIIAMIQPVFR